MTESNQPLEVHSITPNALRLSCEGKVRGISGQKKKCRKRAVWIVGQMPQEFLCGECLGRARDGNA